ncbi:MAG: hypothetical protein QXQ70_00780 [Candidatus Caldarchaeum sp.]
MRNTALSNPSDVTVIPSSSTMKGWAGAIDSQFSVYAIRSMKSHASRSHLDLLSNMN